MKCNQPRPGFELISPCPFSMTINHYIYTRIWSLNDIKSPLVSRTLLSILAGLNYAVVWIVSARPPISNSSSPLIKRLGTVPSVPITIGVNVNLIFESFLDSLARSKYLSSLFAFLYFHSAVYWDAIVLYTTGTLFLFIIITIISIIHTYVKNTHTHTHTHTHT